MTGQLSDQPVFRRCRRDVVLRLANRDVDIETYGLLNVDVHGEDCWESSRRMTAARSEVTLGDGCIAVTGRAPGLTHQMVSNWGDDISSSDQGS